VTEKNETTTRCVLGLVALLVIAAWSASAQSGNSTDAAQLLKPFAFEVISIHRHKPGGPFLPRQLMPDGYRASMSLWDMIMTAYNPQNANYWRISQIHNAPAWIHDMYDINARVAEEDIAVWQQSHHEDLFADPRPLRSALRAMLRERCHLTLQQTPIEVPYLNLAVNRHSTKLTEYVPGAVKPVKGKTFLLGEGFFIQEDGDRRFVGVSMQELANVLTRLSESYPVQDQTGLAGRYSFVLPWYDDPHDSDHTMTNPLDRMPVNGIGLALKPGRGPAFLFTIDHIEKPDAN